MIQSTSSGPTPPPVTNIDWSLSCSSIAAPILPPESMSSSVKTSCFTDHEFLKKKIATFCLYKTRQKPLLVIYIRLCISGDPIIGSLPKSSVSLESNPIIRLPFSIFILLQRSQVSRKRFQSHALKLKSIISHLFEVFDLNC